MTEIAIRKNGLHLRIVDLFQFQINHRVTDGNFQIIWKSNQTAFNRSHNSLWEPGEVWKCKYFTWHREMKQRNLQSHRKLDKSAFAGKINSPRSQSPPLLDQLFGFIFFKNTSEENPDFKTPHSFWYHRHLQTQGPEQQQQQKNLTRGPPHTQHFHKKILSLHGGQLLQRNPLSSFSINFCFKLFN